MSCPTTIEILRSQCIGNSLSIINENFTNLKNAACDNDTRITSFDNSIIELDTTITDLSAVIVPGSARAWCKFSGSRDNNNILSTFFTDRFLYNNYNILSVYRKAKGDYRIIFRNAFSNNRYAIVGTSTEKLDSVSNKYTWLQPYNLTSAYAEVKIQSSEANSLVDPDFVSVVIY